MMKSPQDKKFRSGSIRTHILPLIIWLVAIAGVAMLFLRGTKRFEVVGIAQGQISQVCSPVDGRLKNVYVRLFDEVAKDQVVAALDDELITAQIVTVSATAEHLRSQIIPMQQQLTADMTDRELDRTEQQRRFAVDVERARIDILALKAQIATDRVTLEDLAAEVKIAGDLLKKDAIAPYEMEKAQVLYEAVAKKVIETENQLVHEEENLKNAQLRQDIFAAQTPLNPSVDAALDAIRKEATIQEKLIEQLKIQRNELIITAPINGVVVQILGRTNDVALRRAGEGTLHKSGEVVLAGQPIMVIAQGRPKEIIAYAGERQMDEITPGIKVELVKRTVPAQFAQSEVTFVGPVVEQLPQRLWQNPNIPQWGLPFLVKVPDGMDLTSGEVVAIRRL